jgi:type IX secretion system PorP/SprF family membrane protein
MALLKYIAVACFLLLFFNRAIAQQDLSYTQYMFNGLMINPAYAGNHNALSITGMMRKQWVGIEGAPSTFLVSGHMPLLNNKVGLGVMIFQDRIGVSNKLQASMAYSYKIIKDDKRLSFGLQAMVLDYSQLYSQLDNLNPQDKNFQQNYQQLFLNAGAGIYYETRRYYVGFSVPQLVRNYYEPGNPSSDRQLRQYLLNAGYTFFLHPLVQFKPAGLLQINEELPSTFGLSANFLYNEKIWLGLSYRYRSSMSVLLGLWVTDKMKLGFSYDYLTSDLQKVAKGSMEIMVNYRFQKTKRNEGQFD